MDSVRNSDGIWINSNLFSEVGRYFMKHGYYCTHPWGSPDWADFWQKEREKCLNGVTIGGASITGEHYFYLNYCPIQMVKDTNKKTTRKVNDFPHFWDGDYNYFWIRKIAREGITEEGLKKLHLEVIILPEHLSGGYDVIVGKSRRKGYSYKNASIAALNYFHRPFSYTMYMAYEKKYLYPKGIMSMAKDYINFNNEHTAWSMPSDYVNKQDHIRASYIEVDGRGNKIEKGYKSEIQAISFKDNPDAGRGKDAYDIIGEEVGAWGIPGGLKSTLYAIKPSVKAGKIKTGMITLFGTSGDIEKGTADFASIFERPLAYDFLPFRDIWGTESEKVEGFMHPVHWNMEGFYDSQGNSDKKLAREYELNIRKKLIDNGAVSTDVQSRMREYPLDSNEAFSFISYNNFPILELKRQLLKVKSQGLNLKKGTPVELYYEGKKCLAKPILNGSLTPISSLRDLPTDRSGCIVIYEHPIDNSPRGLYKIGYDPVRQDEGTSLAGVIVYKGAYQGSLFHSTIVAEYIGRLDSPEDIDRLVEKLCDFYNTTVMYENEVTGVKNYFRRIKRLGLLSLQPDVVISKSIKNSKVSRVYGCHMTVQLKDAGERYVKEWLIQVLDYDENDNPVTVIDKIYSVRLLEELISYNRRGNFDLVSALFMCLFQVQEEVLGKEYKGEDNGNENIKKLLSMASKMHVKNSSRII